MEAIKSALLSIQHKRFSRPSRRSLPTTPTPTPTPPPDLESNIENVRSREEDARKTLKEDGCPPCYPNNVEFPLQNVPKHCEAIIGYWKSLPGTGSLVLCAQLSDWGLFRKYQGDIRQHYQQNFYIFQQKVHDRRQRHGLQGDICLHIYPQQQSHLDNWIEFQNYHLDIHEGLAKEIDDRRKELDAERKKLGTSVSGSTAAEDVENFSRRVECDEEKLRMHQTLLQWIEDQRVFLVAQEALLMKTALPQDDQSDAAEEKSTTIRRRTATARRKGQATARPVLGPVRSAVSKTPPLKRRSLRLKERNAARSAEIATPQPTTLPRPSRTQKVFKTVRRFSTRKQSTKANLEPQLPSRLRGGQKQVLREQPERRRRKPIQQSAFKDLTQSGRMKKRPEIFCPS